MTFRIGSFVLLGILVSMIPVRAADFPAFEALPARAELPDPLEMLDGTKITSATDWNSKRRPELKELFQHYMYGYLPARPQKWVVEEVRFTDPAFLDGKATISESRLAFFGPDLKHRLHVILVLPNNVPAGTKVPVFVGMNFCGNHAVTHHPKVHVPEAWVYRSCSGSENERATEQGRGGQTQVWNLDLIIDRGYGFAGFYSGDIDPDTADFADGIQPSFYDKGQTSPKPTDAGTIAAWAWGYHRVVDFLLEKHRDKIDDRRIAVVGHSRNGKTSVLAAAMDERIALAIPHQAGCGGTAPDRVDIDRKDVETIRRINTSFPHWFCDNFPLFNERPDKLPFDQHCLAALCAPRPVLYSNAVEDQWANPDGQFEMLKAAHPVYQLLNSEGLRVSKKPELRTLVDSPLGYYIRPGKHEMNREDWGIFLDFADRHFHQP
ncbi:acetylxylan esterase [Schlesneria sp. T3-172]|uniref:glucuronyl esterase domain-containing protein n=1 Tax=Schlesneria sphaerica TaxID=3373610 RepID=UPI0037CC6D0B